MRETILISHANPSDNDVAAWMAKKLTALGYKVWVDVEKLKGGETFWPEIERVIREDAVRVVLLLSPQSNRAGGVLQEVRVAKTVERKLAKNDFLIPCRIGPVEFDDINIELQGRICIESQRWSQGLKQLIEKFEDAGLPKRSEGIDSDLLATLSTPIDLGVVPQECWYDLNRVQIHSLPGVVFANHSEDAEPGEWGVTTSTILKGRRLSFEPRTGKSQLFGRENPIEISTDELLLTGSDALGIESSDGRRLLVELANKTISRFLFQRGLHPHRLSQFQMAFCYNRDNLPSMKVQVKLPEAQSRSNRNLWGITKQEFWHIGFQSRVLLREDFEWILLPHLFFTTDGATDFVETNRANGMRKARARMWWNDKWRGFYYALLADLSNGENTIKIPIQGNDGLVLSSTLTRARASIAHLSQGGLEREPIEMIDPELEGELEES